MTNKISAQDSDYLRSFGIDSSNLFFNPYSTDEYKGATLEWLDFYTRFSQLKKNVYDGIIELSEENGFSVIKEKLSKIPLPLEVKKTYLAFHIGEGSTVSFKDAPNIDFEGEYSIERMFEEILFEINAKLGITSKDVLMHNGIDYIEKTVKSNIDECLVSKN